MDTVARVVLLLFVAVPVILVAGAFVWAAQKDGRKDSELQERLGIRRRTRLGR